MSITKTLPHWDMTPIYPGLDSQEFADGFSNVVQDIESLAKLPECIYVYHRTIWFVYLL